MTVYWKLTGGYISSLFELAVLPVALMARISSDLHGGATSME
jgi:hypothetical protein